MNPSFEKLGQTEQKEKFDSGCMVYQKSADNYRIVKWIVLVIGILLCIAIAWLGRTNMHAENFRYFAKYLGRESSLSENRFADISYTADADTVFAYYRDGLAVLSHGSFAYYSPNGKLLYRTVSGSDTTVLNADGLYLALYPSGGKTVTLCNAFSVYHTLSLAAPIGAVTVSDGGETAISTVNGSASELTTFAKSGKVLWTKALPDSLTFDLAYSASGDMLSVLSLQSEEGNYKTVLSILNPTSGNEIVAVTFPGEKPVETGFFESGRFYVLTDRTLVFCEKNGERRASIPLVSTVTYSERNGNRLLLASNASADVYSERGSKIASFSCTEKIKQIAICSETVCLVTDKALYQFGLQSDKRATMVGGSFDILADPAAGCVYLCDAGGIRQISVIDP